MSFVSDYLVPVVTVVMVIGVILWVLYIIYWAFKKTFKKMKFFIKYKIFGKPYDEQIVEWCIRADELGYSVDKVKQTLLLPNRHSPKKVEEILYIYLQIKRMKGGSIKQDEQRIRESNRKALPEI